MQEATRRPAITAGDPTEPTPMDDEFDTVALWTADVALDLGPAYAVPAGCRGSGGPAALAWFLGRLRAEPGEVLLDCGAGVGGPAAYARAEAGLVPLLTEPEPGACRAARRLFGLPVVRAGSDLPIRTGSVGLAWCLGVLCTVDDQAHLLGELRRVLAPGGRLGLLAYVAEREPVPDPPVGNHFPTDAALAALLAGAGLAVVDRVRLCELPDPPEDWRERSDAVEAELERRHGADDRWRAAQDQSERLGRLIGDGDVHGTLLVLRPAAPGPAEGG